MIPRYFLIKKDQKKSFEKKWQMPHGFKSCPVTTNPDDAKSWLIRIIEMGENPDQWQIGKITENGHTELFYQK